MQKIISFTKNKKILNNLLKNFYFIFSCIIFNSIVVIVNNSNIKYSLKQCIIISGIAAVIYSMLNSSFYKEFKTRNLPNKIFSALATFGIDLFYLQRLNLVDLLNKWISIENIEKYNNLILIVLGIFTIPFLIVLFSKIYAYLEKALKNIYKESTKNEKIIFLIIVVLLLIFAIGTFINASVFYASDKKYNIVYTSDSPLLITQNAWLNAFHLENDIRQPLFGIFAAPFIAPFYSVFGWFDNSNPIVMAIIIAIVNIFVIALTAYILASITENKSNRILFFLLYMSMFSTLLFTIMLEQYSFAVFWMILLIYMYANNIEDRKLSYVGATGGLLTTGILFPLICNKGDKISKKIKDILITFLYFVFIMLIFARLDVIMTVGTKLSILMKYTGGKLAFIDRFMQYVQFIPNCFIGMNSGPLNNTWKSNSISNFNVIGIILIVLCTISAYINRKDKISRISAFWYIYSFVILCIIGWGTMENGLVLYSLYFAWAFLILIYKLLKRVFEKFNLEKAFRIIIIAISTFLLTYNVIQLCKMIIYLSQFS